jgi:hypothetical protein
MRKLKTSALVVFGLSILFYLFFDLCKHAPGIGAANPFASDPYDAVGAFGIMLALLGALLMLVRVFRPYPQTRMPPAQLLLALRAGGVTLLSVTITLAADAIGLARDILTNGASPEAWRLAGLVGGMMLLTLAVGWTFVRAARGAEVPSGPRPWARTGIITVLVFLILTFYPLSWRDSGIPGGILTALTGMALLFVPVWAVATAIFPEIEFAYEDVFDDLSAVFQGWKNRLGRLAAPLIWMEKATALMPMRIFFGWFSPRKHRLSLVVLVAVAMGVCLVLVETVVEGMPGNLGRLLMVICIYIGIGGTGVTLGYVLLAHFMGIFRK